METNCQLTFSLFIFLGIDSLQCRDGRPAPRGTLPAGKGGFPAPPRPVKMIKTAGKLRGKINTRISTFSKRGKKWWNNITTLNNAQSSLSIGYARESKKWKYLLLFLLTGQFVNIWNISSMSKISSLVLLMMMAIMLVMVLMIIMMLMLIVITIKIMNVE